jgi:hypothetical protein
MNTNVAPGLDLYRDGLNAFPAPVFVVDADVRIQFANAAAQPLPGDHPEQALSRRGGEALHCVHSTATPAGCGHAEACKHCVGRNSVNAAFAGAKTNRSMTKMVLRTDKGQCEIFLLITTTPFQHGATRLALLVLEDVNELVHLRKVLPICASCKKIRDDKEYWADVESYFKRQLDVDFSHGICPDCFRTLYPQYVDEIVGKQPHQA